MLPVKLKKVHRLINHGPTVLFSSSHEGVDDAMAAVWACGLDFMLPKFTVMIDSATTTRVLIDQSAEFVLRVPAPGQATLTMSWATSVYPPPPTSCADTV